MYTDVKTEQSDHQAMKQLRYAEQIVWLERGVDQMRWRKDDNKPQKAQKPYASDYPSAGIGIRNFMLRHTVFLAQTRYRVIFRLFHRQHDVFFIAALIVADITAGDQISLHDDAHIRCIELPIDDGAFANKTADADIALDERRQAIGT